MSSEKQYGNFDKMESIDSFATIFHEYLTLKNQSMTCLVLDDVKFIMTSK